MYALVNFVLQKHTVFSVCFGSNEDGESFRDRLFALLAVILGTINVSLTADDILSAVDSAAGNAEGKVGSISEQAGATAFAVDSNVEAVAASVGVMIPATFLLKNFQQPISVWLNEKISCLKAAIGAKVEELGLVAVIIYMVFQYYLDPSTYDLAAMCLSLTALGTQFTAEFPSLVFQYLFCAKCCPCCLPKNDAEKGQPSLV